jgi:hypothetical protein
MTVWNVDIMWAMVLLGVALFTGCCTVFNPVLRGMRLMGTISAYAVGAWMAFTLPPVVAVTTWCVFAAAGGVVAFAYELWARRRYAGTGRTPRPLVALQGFVLWPAMIPDAAEGMLVDLGILAPSGRPHVRTGTADPSALGVASGSRAP